MKKKKNEKIKKKKKGNENANPNKFQLIFFWKTTNLEYFENIAFYRILFMFILPQVIYIQFILLDLDEFFRSANILP